MTQNCHYRSLPAAAERNRSRVAHMRVVDRGLGGDVGALSVADI